MLWQRRELCLEDAREGERETTKPTPTHPPTHPPHPPPTHHPPTHPLTIRGLRSVYPPTHFFKNGGPARAIAFHPLTRRFGRRQGLSLDASGASDANGKCFATGTCSVRSNTTPIVESSNHSHTPLTNWLS